LIRELEKLAKSTTDYKIKQGIYNYYIVTKIINGEYKYNDDIVNFEFLEIKKNNDLIDIRR